MRAILAFLLLAMSSSAAIVPIVVSYDVGESHQKCQGSGFVVGTLKDDSVVVSAGHVFSGGEVKLIKVYGKEAKLLHFEHSQQADVAILSVKVNWSHQWELSDGQANDYIFMSGYVGKEIKVIRGRLTNNYISEGRCEPGMSGGPILVNRGDKDVCVGIVNAVNSNASVKESYYCPMSVIRSRLDKYAKGWKSE